MQLSDSNLESPEETSKARRTGSILDQFLPEAKEKRGLIDLNCRTFQDALNDVFSRSWEQDEQQPESTT